MNLPSSCSEGKGKVTLWLWRLTDECWMLVTYLKKRALWELIVFFQADPYKSRGPTEILVYRLWAALSREWKYIQYIIAQQTYSYSWCQWLHVTQSCTFGLMGFFEFILKDTIKKTRLWFTGLFQYRKIYKGLKALLRMYEYLKKKQL